jgi:hypothetical protein
MVRLRKGGRSVMWRGAGLILAAAITSGCVDPGPSPWFPGYEDPILLDAALSVGDLTLATDRIFGGGGDEEGGLWFGRAHRVVVADDGRAAVTDPMHECSIVILDPESGEFTRLGECSDGPNGFRRPTELAWSADTVAVWDQLRGDLSFLHPDEGVVRRLRLPEPLVATTIQFGDFGFVSDSVFALSFSTVVTDDGRGPGHLALVHAGTGETLAVHLESPPIELATRGAIVTPLLCVQRPAGGGAPRVVVANAWTPQILVFRVEGTALVAEANVELDVPWSAATPFADGTGWQARPVDRVVCGPEALLVYQSRWQVVDELGTRAPHQIRIDVIAYDGTHLAVHEREAPDLDPALLALPMAWTGSNLLGTANNLFDYPLVKRVRVNLGKAEAGG